MVAFVFSGGASHSAVQVGMLRALAEAGIEPDALYGTSAGAINAAVISRLPPTERLEALIAAWRTFIKRPPLPRSLRRSAMTVIGRRAALSDPWPLRTQLFETFGDARIEDSAIPLFITATNLLSGHERLFDSGNLIETLMASCAVPGLFPPVEIDGTPFVDGLLYGAPARAAVEAEHDTLYLLLTNSVLPADQVPTSWWGIARRAATMIMWNQLLAPAQGDAGTGATIRIVPAPISLSKVGRWDFKHTEALLAESYEVASRWLAKSADEELVP
ncbi:MAG TPA: patatin-like phospholipase family protein [Frankiaceae bacterium]|jgi:NTE family protein|nr:patatin-like phospholipase family protein [Frankiaceae bacterium]